MKQVLAIALLLWSGVCLAQTPPPDHQACSAHLKWDQPPLRMDGTALKKEDIAYYNVYVSLSPEPRDEEYILILELDKSSQQVVQINDLGRLELYFFVTTTDTEGRESAHSNVEFKDCRTREEIEADAAG